MGEMEGSTSVGASDGGSVVGELEGLLAVIGALDGADVVGDTDGLDDVIPPD